MVGQLSQERIHARPRRTSAEKGSLFRCMLAEFIGTFFLTFVSAAPIVIDSFAGQVTLFDKVAPAGMLVAAMIYTVGPVSGAHFNPAVTLAFAERGDLKWKLVPAYWLAEFGGAIAAAAVTVGLFGGGGHAGANVPTGSPWQSFILETILTLLLVMVILGTAKNHRLMGPDAALGVGMVIILDGIVGGPISGGSMNPARSLGPAIFGGTLDSIWIYLAGPFLGSTLAALVTHAIHGYRNRDEMQEAQGHQRARNDVDQDGDGKA